MLITTANSPYAQTTRTARAAAQTSEAAPTEAPQGSGDSFVSDASPRANEENPISWGPVLGGVAGYAAVSGLAAAGLGWASAVPAFVVGGATGLAATFLVADAVLSTGGDSSASGPISTFLGVAGGVACAFTAASLALSHGSATMALGAALAATGVAAAGGAYLRYS